MPLAQPLATQGIELLLQSGLDALAAPHDAAAPEPAGAPAVVMFRPETPLREALQARACKVHRTRSRLRRPLRAR
jgi:hypothetical protein